MAALVDADTISFDMMFIVDILDTLEI